MSFVSKKKVDFKLDKKECNLANVSHIMIFVREGNMEI